MKQSTARILISVVVLCSAGALAVQDAFADGLGEIVNSKEEALEHNGFTGTSSSTATYETVSGSRMQCLGSTSYVGSVTSKFKGSLTAKLTGCSSAGLKCHTGIEGAGIVVIPMTFNTAVAAAKDYLNLEVPEVDIKCSTMDIKAHGGYPVPANPEESLKTHYTFSAEGKKGVQSPVDTVTPHLELNFASRGFEHASVQASLLEFTFEEAMELK